MKSREYKGYKQSSTAIPLVLSALLVSTIEACGSMSTGDGGAAIIMLPKLILPCLFDLR